MFLCEVGIEMLQDEITKTNLHLFPVSNEADETFNRDDSAAFTYFSYFVHFSIKMKMFAIFLVIARLKLFLLK